MPTTDTIDSGAVRTGELVTTAPATPAKAKPRRSKADDNPALLFERLATDPNASVEKIERLMALWERGEAKKAEAAFNSAMSAAQREMRPVAADADNPQTHSKYASYAALDRALRSIYTTHGFGLSFNTAEGAPELHVRVVCYVTHAAGHGRNYHIDMPADGKGAKGGDVMTKTHAAGSAISYGMRYLLKMIFNIAVGEDDDDGNRAGATTAKPEKEPEPIPAGYDNWLLDMEVSAGEGWPTLSKAFSNSKPEYRKRVTGLDKAKWTALRAKAEKAVKA